MTDPWYLKPRWKKLRASILKRDRYMDQLEIRSGKHVQAKIVHHIFPRERYPEYQWEPWNLISLSQTSHELMHNRLAGGLSAMGEELQLETAEKNGIPLSRLILVVGMPGSGKTTYVRKHLGGGIAYDLDYLAAAFRLRSPHEETHKAARKMANSMVQGFAQNARHYSGTVYMIRTAPELDEVFKIEPDRIIFCEKNNNISERKDLSDKLDRFEIEIRLKELKEYAEANKIPVDLVV